MILGIGVDLLRIERMARALENPRFAQRVFAPGEQDYIREKGAASAAGMFAAKEAFAKALGCGLAGFGLQEAEVTHGPDGRPQLVLSGKALEAFTRLGGRKAWLSISHSEDSAVAQVVLEGEA